MIAPAKPFRLGAIDVGYMTNSTRLDQGADHGGAERAGSAGDNNLAVAIIHRLLHPFTRGLDPRVRHLFSKGCIAGSSPVMTM